MARSTPLSVTVAWVIAVIVFVIIVLSLVLLIYLGGKEGKTEAWNAWMDRTLPWRKSKGGKRTGRQRKLRSSVDQTQRKKMVDEDVEMGEMRREEGRGRA
ncbi:hypothetical protein LTS18_001087 [Coniosporium uncinatum]|uniref:Uncharacterized protein n=1 Tax=Coniosporium uncinatum TaxID=93489 RepID=A0ACC3DZ05_9PEZI|nr:hypothetical protein LTS18_001087 [Coniosporium uncinatum]